MWSYPVFLALKGRRCVVVGGETPIAEEKVGALLAEKAAVVVIWPRLSAPLQELARAGRIAHVARGYRRGDLAGAFLVIGTATQDHALNEALWQEAQERNLLINVVDDPAHCGFIAPSIVRRGDLTIAISTNGKAPALAVRLRQRLERELGHEYGRFLELTGALRVPLAVRYPDFQQRRAIWYRLVDSDVLDLLRAGDEAAARSRLAELAGLAPLESWPEEPSALPEHGDWA
jgi:precorrin-2 dehydrogenase / sirohydrochlorin ferrochelatase